MHMNIPVIFHPKGAMALTWYDGNAGIFNGFSSVCSPFPSFLPFFFAHSLALPFLPSTPNLISFSGRLGWFWLVGMIDFLGTYIHTSVWLDVQAATSARPNVSFGSRGFTTDIVRPGVARRRSCHWFASFPLFLTMTGSLCSTREYQFRSRRFHSCSSLTHRMNILGWQPRLSVMDLPGRGPAWLY